MAPFDITSCNAYVIVSSDMCHKNPTEDSSGQYVVEKLKSLNFHNVTKIIVADEKADIIRNVETTLKDDNNALIITVGGTGFCPRDVTPEATSYFYERHCSGVATALHMASLRYSPYAALSRLTSGITGKCLIVNFPGKLKACKECYACLKGFLVHALEQIRFDAEAIKKTHLKYDELQQIGQLQDSRVSSSSKDISEEVTCLSDQLDLLSVQTNVCETLPPAPPIQSSSYSTESSSISEVCKANTISQDIFLDSSKISTRSVKLRSPLSGIIRIGSSWPPIEYAQALDILGSLTSDLCQYDILSLNSLEASHKILGQVLAKKVCSKTLVPPFPVSTMDGYVLNVPVTIRNMLNSIGLVQAKLLDNKSQFDLLQSDPKHSTSFFCYQVNTGGRVPERNFAVIPFEETGPPSTAGMIPIFKLVLDRYVRSAGSDLNHSDFLNAGIKISPIELSLILAMGYKQIEIIKKPIIGVLSTGDELIEPYCHSFEDSTNVYDCNLPLLTSLFMSKGLSVISNGIAKDDPQDLSTKIIASLDKCDILVITGGASMGTKDYVKSVIEDLGGVIHFGRVNMKPGKPVAFASIVQDNRKKFIFSLPGNPVSAYITATVLVQPFIEHGLKKYLGSDTQLSIEDLGKLITVEVASIIDNDGDKEYVLAENRLEFIRARFVDKEERQVEVSIKQQSSRLLSLKNFDCLLMIDPSYDGSQLMVGQTHEALKLFSN